MVCQGRQAFRVHLDPLGVREGLDETDWKDCLDRRVERETLDFLVCPERGDRVGFPGHRALQDPKDCRERRAFPSKGPKEWTELLEETASLV